MPDSFTNEKIDSAIGRTLARRSISPVRVPQGTALKLDEAVQSVTTDKNTLLNLSYNKAVQDDNPDREAEIQSLSKSTGLPHRTIRQNLERVQQQTKSRRFQSMDMVKEFPHLSRYMSKRDNARLVTDDLERLQELEKLMAPAKPSTTKRIAKGIAGSFIAGTVPSLLQAFTGFGESTMLIADQFVGESFRQLTHGGELPFKMFAKGFGGLRQAAKAAEEATLPEITPETGRLERGAFSMGRSIGVMLTALGMGGLAGSLRLTPTMMGGVVGGMETGRALDVGVEPARALAFGVTQGATEAIFESSPFFRLLKDLKIGAPLGRTLINNILLETATEIPTTIAQNFNDWAILQSKDTPFSEYLAQLPSDIYDTVIATVMTAGVQTTMLHTVNRFVAGRGETERVEAQGEMLDNMDKLANDSKLRERSVDSFEEFVKDAAEDGPMQDVYIDAEVLNQSGLDLEGMSDEVKSQMQTGADIDTPVRIPIEEYAARIAGQEGSKKLLEHLKMNPNDISRAEMKTAKKEQDAELQAEVEEILTTSQEEILFEDSKQAVEDKVFGELEKAARFTEDVNRADAVLASSYYAVQAERLGITPEAMFERYPLKVRSEDTPGFSFEEIEKRGKFVPSARTIILLEDSDLSTFLHEFGHFMLETQFDISTQENAPQEIIDDADVLLKWFGVKGKTPLERSASWGSMTLKEKTKSHERLAKGFEAYLFQGKAPSSELRKVFQRFRAWLVSIYKKLKNINVKLTPEVTQVFDRMLATDAAIEETERLARYGPLFESAEQANMTPEEFIDYQHQGADATLDAIETLDTRNLRDMKWLSGARSRGLKKMQAEAKAKRRQIAIEVTEEVLNEPVYQAMQFLKRGLINGEKVAEGAQHKMSTTFVKAMLGAEEYNALRGWFGKFGLLAEDGMHPDVVAEMFGYTSGDQLLTELQNAEVMKDKIEGITDQRMLERHGELVDQDAIEVAVMDSLKNKTRVKFIEAEVTALNKAAGRKLFLTKAARQLAEDIINRQQIKSLRPHQYEAAETKAAREKEKAFRKGDVELAAMNGRNQLINLYAGKGARTALLDVKKGLTYTKNLVRKLRKGRKFLDADVRDQIMSLLDQYDMQRISTRELERRISLREWVENQKNIGKEADIPEDILDRVQRISYKELTVEEFNGLMDTVKQIEHFGKQRNKFLSAQFEWEYEKLKADALEALAENAPKNPAEVRSRTNAGDKFKRWHKRYHASHRKAANLLQLMTGEGGPLWEAWNLLNDAGDNETTMRGEATERLAKPMGVVIDKEDIGGKGVYYPTMGFSFNREEVMSVVLNLGNEGNKQRMLDAEGWTLENIQPLIDSLTKEETVLIQAVWDHFQSYWPQTQALERRLLGRSPKEVEAIPVETPHGTLTGGYYPIRNDPDRSSAVQREEDLADAERMTKNAFTASNTRRGYVKRRAAKVTDRPIHYSFQTIFQATEEIIHDLTHHEALMDVNKIFRDKDIDAAIRKHYGPEALDIVIKGAIQDIAVGSTPAQKGFEEAIDHVRKGSTIAALAWSATVSGLQPIGITNSVVRIGSKWVIQGAITVMKNPIKVTQQMYIDSSFMFNRPKTLNREINEIQNTIRQFGVLKRVAGKLIGRKPVRLIDEFMKWSLFQVIQKTQFVVDVITWQGAREKYAGESDKKAIALSNQAVIDSQGSGMIKDQSAIQRGSPLQKLWTNFHSFFNLVYNLNADIKGRTDWKNPAQVSLAVYQYSLTMIVPAIMASLLRDVISASGDDDKWDWENVASRMVKEQISFLLGMMIGLREFEAVFQIAGEQITGRPGYRPTYGGPAGARIIQASGRLATQVSQRELDDAFRKASVDFICLTFHCPGAQINRTWTGVQALSDGSTRNPTALLGGFRR